MNERYSFDSGCFYDRVRKCGLGPIGSTKHKSNETESAIELVRRANAYGRAIEALKGVVHHNDGLKDAYKLSPALMRHVEAAISKAETP